MKLEIINEYLEERDESAILVTGFEDAIIGFAQRCGEPLVAVYDYDKMVNIMMFRDDLSYDDAAEFIDANIVCMWAGPRTPVIVMPLTQEDAF